MSRIFSSLLTAVALAVLLAGAGQAADFVSGTLTVRLAGLPPLTLGDNGAATGVAGDGNNTPITLGPQFFGPGNIDIPDSLFTGVPQIADLRIVGLDEPGGNTTAMFTSTGGFGGGFGGAGALSGTATICVFNCGAIQVAIPLNVIGVGGTLYSTALFQPLTVTADNGWTTGAAVITGISTELVSDGAGGMCAPVTCPPTALANPGLNSFVSTVTITGSDTRNANGTGVVTLVTPVRTNSLAGALPLFAILEMEFVPEPAELLMLGAGAALLAAYGRWVMRKSR